MNPVILILTALLLALGPVSFAGQAEINGGNAALAGLEQSLNTEKETLAQKQADLDAATREAEEKAEDLLLAGGDEEKRVAKAAADKAEADRLAKEKLRNKQRDEVVKPLEKTFEQNKQALADAQARNNQGGTQPGSDKPATPTTDTPATVDKPASPELTGPEPGSTARTAEGYDYIVGDQASAEAAAFSGAQGNTDPGHSSIIGTNAEGGNGTLGVTQDSAGIGRVENVSPTAVSGLSTNGQQGNFEFQNYSNTPSGTNAIYTDGRGNQLSMPVTQDAAAGYRLTSSNIPAPTRVPGATGGGSVLSGTPTLQSNGILTNGRPAPITTLPAYRTFDANFLDGLDNRGVTGRRPAAPAAFQGVTRPSAASQIIDLRGMVLPPN